MRGPLGLSATGELVFDDNIIELVLLAVVVILAVVYDVASTVLEHWRRQRPWARRLITLLMVVGVAFILYGTIVTKALWAVLVGMIVGPFVVGMHALWTYLSHTGRPRGLERPTTSPGILDKVIDRLADRSAILRDDSLDADRHVGGGDKEQGKPDRKRPPPD